MEISFSPRDNGACPVCRRAPTCIVRQALAQSVKDLRGPREADMEIVIYSCPLFVERPQP